MTKYLLFFLVNFNAWAGSTFQVLDRTMNSNTLVQDNADKYIRVCSTPIYDIPIGTTLKVRGKVQTDNETRIVIGVTSQIFFCNLDATQCRLKVAPSDHNELDGGNLEPVDHHGVFRPYARVTTTYYLPSVLAALYIRVYSTAETGSEKLNVTSCQIEVERINDY